VRKVSKQYGKLQQFVTSTDLTKLVRPLGGAAGAQPLRANPIVKTAAYACKEWAIDASVPNEVIANADQDLGTALGAYVRDTWMLAREYAVAQLLTTPGTWAAANQISPSVIWSNVSTAKPVDDVMAALQVSKNPRPNLLVMSEQVGRYWYDSTNVQAFVQAGGLDALKLSVMTVGFKVTSAGSGSANQVDIWAAVGNHAVLVRADEIGPDDHRAPIARILLETQRGSKSITTAATARWKGDEIRRVPQGETWVMVDDVLMRTFWEPRGGARGLCGCVLVVNESVTMIDNTLGAIIKTVA
jgi:hypothetical protein